MVTSRLAAVVALLVLAWSFGGAAAQEPSPPPTVPMPVPMPSPATGLTITSFECSNGFGKIYAFTGTVQNNTSSTNVTINFSNLPSLNGKSCAVNDDGTFTLIVQLGAGESGTAYAQAVDDLGDQSEEAECFVL